MALIFLFFFPFKGYNKPRETRRDTNSCARKGNKRKNLPLFVSFPRVSLTGLLKRPPLFVSFDEGFFKGSVLSYAATLFVSFDEGFFKGCVS